MNEEQIGTVAVDGGSIWIGDVSRAQDVSPRQALDGEQTGQSRVTRIEDGVALTAGYGDGEYPVYVRRRPDGRIAEMRVVFIEE